uniref:phage minor head protein n=1 Tax=uncultured Halomonas sp. TaxID=173971 RepID=UPI002632D307
KSLQAFRKDFRDIVERRGWHGWTGEGSKKGTAWRTRVIYQTNASTSYAAGRLAQLREGGFSYWVYKHGGSADPRPEHLAWDGLTLPPDDPFWQSHYPPNGWGCGCYVVGARSKRGAKRLGGSPDKGRPSNWDATDSKTGAPPGIGKGWDYQPGDRVSNTVRQMAEKTRQWDYELAKGYMQGVPASVRDQLARSYRALPSVADDARRYAQRVLGGRDKTLDTPRYLTLGLLTGPDARRIGELKERDVTGFDFALDASAVRHIASTHGSEATERPRGQRAVTARDYAVLGQLLNEGAGWQDAGASKRSGQPLVKRRLERNGEVFEAVFEVRRKRKMLALETFYVRPKE